MIDVKEPSSLWAVPPAGLVIIGAIRKAGRARYREQDSSSIPPLFLLPLLPPGPCFESLASLPLMIVYDVELKVKKPFAPYTAFGWCQRSTRNTKGFHLLGFVRQWRA